MDNLHVPFCGNDCDHVYQLEHPMMRHAEIVLNVDRSVSQATLDLTIC